MKGVLVIIDGLGDLPCKQLNDKTPLEAAEKPNLDYLAGRGKLGFMYSVKEGAVPESDTAVVSILGNDVMGSSRGFLEALGAEIEIKHGDVALRTNFATIDNLENKKVIDRRAGRTLTSEEAGILAKAINKNAKLNCKFIFKNTIQHRGVLVLKGGFSDNISNTDSAYHSQGKAKISDFFKYSKALDEDENSDYTSDIVNSFIEQSYKILNEHPVNKERRRKGLLPANIVMTRDASTKIDLKKFSKWASIVYMPLEIGICKASEMRVFSFSYPEMKNHDVYENLNSGLKEAVDFSIKTIEKEKNNFDYFYVHFKETDVPGHDNKPEEKMKMIEFLDKEFFSFLRKFEKAETKIIVTGDHSTPCSLKNHSSDAVPFLFCDWKENSQGEFSEKSAKLGKLGKIYGRNVMKMLEKQQKKTGNCEFAGYEQETAREQLRKIE